MNRHLSDDELIDRLYGLGSASGHLDGCSECQQRFVGMQQRRQQAVFAGVPMVSAKTLPAWNRLWIPATLAVGLIVGVVALQRPEPTTGPPPGNVEMLEAGWFEETYSSAHDLEPRAASPMRALFAETRTAE
jgi:hypothetical protein